MEPSLGNMRSPLRMVIVVVALAGAVLPAQAFPPQAQGLSEAQRATLKERNRLDQQAFALRAQGKTAEAIRAAEAMLAIDIDVLGKTSEDAIRAMRLIAQLNEDREDWAAARKGWTEVQTLWIQRQGKDGENVTEARWALERIEALARMSEQDRRRLKESDRIEQQGLKLLNQGKVDEAMPLLRQAPAIREELHRVRTGEYVIDLVNLGVAFEKQKKLDDALGCYKRGLAISEAICGNGSYMLGMNLEFIATILEKQGKTAEARQYLERAVSMNEAIYPRDRYPWGSTYMAKDLTRIGNLLLAEGKLVESRRAQERALAMFEQLYPRNKYPRGTIEFASCLHQLALVLCRQDVQGNYAASRRCYERCLEMRQALYSRDKFPQGHVLVAVTLGNLGLLLDEAGNPSEARGFLAQALEMYQRLFPRDRYPRGHANIATTLDNLGRVSDDLGNLEEARQYYLRSLAMKEALYPQDRYPRGHGSIATVLVDLGKLSYTRHQYREALDYFERGLKMLQALSPEDNAGLDVLHNDIASALIAQGNYDLAEKHYQQALQMCQKTYPKESYPDGHPSLALSLANLGSLLMRRGEYAQAWPLLDQAVEMSDRLNEQFVATASEAEAMGYVALTKARFWRLISCSMSLPDRTDSVYAHVWRRKAMIARMLGIRQKSVTQRANFDPATSQVLTAWNDCRQQLARMMLSQSGDQGKNAERIRQLTAQKEGLERQLTDFMPEFARDQRLELPPHGELLKTLPEGMVVVDLVKYSRLVQDLRIKGDAGARQTPSYVGFVLARESSVQRLDLGPAAVINDAVLQWRAAIVKRQTSPAVDTLRRLVWQPISRHLPAGTKTVIVVPDGLLTAIPWGALPGEQPGTFLLEQYAFAVAPHAPFVLDLLNAEPRATGAEGTLLAVGAMPRDFPLAVQELEAVISLARPRRVIELQGNSASTSQVLRALPQARWVHFDTHGFFAGPEIQSVLQTDANPLDRLRRMGADSLARNPLVLSGLVLRASQGQSALTQPATPEDHDILTAEVIAGQPLEGLDLAVLSACETGLGTVAGGEGVFGLQRAFHLAGAQTVVASLWSVGDLATVVLMTGMYNNLWHKNLSRLEALRQAQLTMITRYRRRETKASSSRGKDQTKAVASGEPDQLPPFLWAGFVLSGDWR